MKKKIFIVLFTIFSIINIEKVNAYEDSFYTDNWIPDIYTRKQNGAHIQNQQARFTRRKSDGMFAYCVEHGIAVLDNEIYNGNHVDSFDDLNISKEVMDKIKVIAYYGYGYDNHTDDKWYAITQVLIWKTLYPYMDIYYTDTFRGNKIEKFVSEEQELLNLVNNHYTLPSFTNETKVIKLGDTIYLNDSNNVLNNYEILHNDTVNSKITNNTIEIKANKSGKTTLKLQKKTNRFNSPLILWSNSNSQDLVTTGNYDTIEINLNLEIYDTKLTINKIGEMVEIKDNKYSYIDTKLSNVKFNIIANDDIYDNNELKYTKNDLIDTLITDENGMTTISNLYYGKYKLVEISSSNNNEILKDDVEFEINENNPYINLNIKNYYNKKTLEFIKVDNITNQPLSNTEIEIYTDDDKLIYTGTTDNNGTILLDNMFIGKFYIKEIKAKDGYQLSDDIINFEIKEDDIDPIKIIMTNETIKEVPNTFKNEMLNEQLIFGIFISIFGIYGFKKFKH